MLHQTDSLGAHAITSQAGNDAYRAAVPRNDMAELSNAHGFPQAHDLLPVAAQPDAANAPKVDVAANKPATADVPANRAPDAVVADASQATSAPGSTYNEGNHQTYDVRVASVMGNDTKGSIDTPATVAMNSVDTIDARPSVMPVDQPQQQQQQQARNDAAPTPAQQQNNFQPAPRADIVG